MKVNRVISLLTKKHRSKYYSRQSIRLIIIQLLDLENSSFWPKVYFLFMLKIFKAYLIQRLLFIIVYNFWPCLKNLILVSPSLYFVKFAFLLILQLVYEVVNDLQFVTLKEPSLDSFTACWHS